MAGIFLERNAIHVAIADISPGTHRHTIEFAETIRFTPDNAITALRNLARDLTRGKVNLKAVGIGCYGPFERLGADRQSEGYGKLRAKTAEPFAGADLPALFQKEMGQHDFPIIVQSDANVLALGEAYLAHLDDDDVLVSLLLSEGIGGGFVAGRRLLGALHPEMGLLHVDMRVDDPLWKIRRERRSRISLQQMCAIPAMLDRARQLRKEKELDIPNPRHLDDILAVEHPRLWPVVADYVAQLCLTCTAILSPRNIVLCGPLIRHFHFIDEVNDCFRKSMRARRDGDIDFTYEHLEKPNYIRGPAEDGPLPALEGCVILAMRGLPNILTLARG